MSEECPRARVMVDIETWGTRPGSVIVSIGACRFDTPAHLSDQFSVVIDAHNSMLHGLTVDAATLYWWLKQSDAARAAVCEEGYDLYGALHSFSEWLKPAGEEVEVWAKGSDFDLPMLTAAFDACRMVVPWKYSNARDLRTLLSLLPDRGPRTVQRPGIPHRALDDAVHQAKLALAAMEALRLGEVSGAI